MLQASLLQYPHFGVFPGAAAAAAAAAGGGLYPGLTASAAAGVHLPPTDFYAAAQSLPPGLLMSMKMPNVSAANWLGLDRSDSMWLLLFKGLVLRVKVAHTRLPSVGFQS